MFCVLFLFKFNFCLCVLLCAVRVEKVSRKFLHFSKEGTDNQFFQFYKNSKNCFHVLYRVFQLPFSQLFSFNVDNCSTNFLVNSTCGGWSSCIVYHVANDGGSVLLLSILHFGHSDCQIEPFLGLFIHACKNERSF